MSNLGTQGRPVYNFDSRSRQMRPASRRNERDKSINRVALLQISLPRAHNFLTLILFSFFLAVSLWGEVQHAGHNYERCLAGVASKIMQQQAGPLTVHWLGFCPLPPTSQSRRRSHSHQRAIAAYIL